MKRAISLKEHQRIIELLRKEIDRKDKIIEKLKEENHIILKTALKQAEKHDELLKRVHRSLKGE